MITQDTLNILVENRLNDSKAWYDAHKPEIKKLVLDPFFEIIENLAPTMLSVDREMVVEPKVSRTLSRIHRDTRFSNDKARYRDSIWLYFNRDKKLYPGYPGFFFELRPSHVWWGCGFYLADPALAASCRKMILERDPLFMEAKKTMDVSSTFVLDDSDRFKRTRFPDEPEEYRRWLDRRSIYFAHTEDDPAAAFDERFSARLRDDFLALTPLYRFMCAACERSITPERVLRRG